MGKNHKRILIIDDEANVRTVFSDVLRREGYIVKAVKNEPEALKAVEEENFDLALVDLRIPKMDGIEILENIKKRKPQIAVIIYTGYGSVTTAVAAMRKGAADYFSKPFSPEELKSSIRKALEGAEEHNSIVPPLSSGGRSTLYKPDKNLIRGERIRVTVETTKYRISGKVFVRYDLRLSDLLNETRKGFLVLTDVQVFSLTDNAILYEKDFLPVNKNQIVLVSEGH